MVRQLTFDRVDWWSFAVLAVSIRAQLSALVFRKSMNMKDIKGVQVAIRDSGLETKPQIVEVHDTNGAENLESVNMLTEDAAVDEEVATKFVPKKADDHVTKDQIALKIRQGAINLVGVDAQRISDFCGFNQEIPGTILKILIAVAFLIQLIGWWAVLAGAAVSIAFQPLNSIAAKHYYAQQSAVMAARDTKTHVVTEALQGIRQIKFSAIEDQWQKSMLAARDIELEKQWRAFVWGIYLSFCWVSSPVPLLGTLCKV